MKIITHDLNHDFTVLTIKNASQKFVTNVTKIRHKRHKNSSQKIFKQKLSQKFVTKFRHKRHKNSSQKFVTKIRHKDSSQTSQKFLKKIVTKFVTKICHKCHKKSSQKVVTKICQCFTYHRYQNNTKA
jgi:hypothetical protein